VKSLLLSTAIAATLALPALAQNAEIFRSEMAEGNVTASDLIGARIYAAEAAIEGDAFEGVQDNWEDIGEVNDVILSRDGNVDSVIVDIGGFLGMGERQVAVDMTALRFVQDSATDADDWFLVLQADRPTLEGAPEWVMPSADTAANDAAETDAQMTAEGEAATDATATEGTEMAEGEAATDATATADTEVAEGDAAADATVAEGTETEMAEGEAATDAAATDAPVVAEGDAATEATDEQMTAEGTDAAATDAMTEEPVVAEGEAATDAATTEQPEVAETMPARDPIVRDGYGSVDVSALTSEMLTDAPVYDESDTSIGEVVDLVLTDDGQVTQVVMDIGGFLGLGEHRVALEMGQIDILSRTDGGEVRVYVPMSKEQLEALPKFDS
jgi:hypothetical protein